MRSCVAIITFSMATLSASAGPESLAELATGTVAERRLDHDGTLEDPLQPRGRILVVVDLADRCRELMPPTSFREVATLGRHGHQ